MKKLVIYGTGRYAQYVFDHDTNYDVVAFCIVSSYHTAESFSQRRLIPFFNEMEVHFSPESHNLFIAVGENDIRKRIYNEALKRKYVLASYVSSKAITWTNLKLGKNCFIGEGSTIQPFVEIGDNRIFFAANIGHHSRIGNNILLSSMTLGGNVEVGNNCFLGMNSTVAQNVKVEKNTIIGMECTINQDTSPHSVNSIKGTSKRKIPSDEVSKRFLR